MKYFSAHACLGADRAKYPARKKYNSMKLYTVPDLSHVESIQLGKVLETFLGQLVDESLITRRLGLKNLFLSGGYKKQIDLVARIQNDKIYFFEVKTNCELDTEKFPETKRKINEIVAEMKLHFGTEVQGVILTPWWEFEKEMPLQYADTAIMFAKQFFDLISLEYSRDEWYNDLNELAKTWRQK